MKKLLLIYCFLFSFCVNAQTVNTLLRQGDSLRRIQKYKQAARLYDKAISNVISYNERVTDWDWLKLSLASQQANSHINKKIKPHYVNLDYADEGGKLKEKIQELKTQGMKSIFTFKDRGGMTVNSYIITDSVTNTKVGLGESYKTFLVWQTNDDVFMQAFGSCNIYKPLRLGNNPLYDLLKLHHDKLASETIKYAKPIATELSHYYFDFYVPDGVFKKEIADAKDLIDLSINAKAYLTQLLPMVKGEIGSYLRRTKTE